MKKIAVLGATGAVGLQILDDLAFLPEGEFTVEGFASKKSAGKEIGFRDKSIKVQEWTLEAMDGFDFVLMSVGGEFSKKYAQSIAKKVPVVIDNSSAWREDTKIPLIIPEVNGSELDADYKGIIASPNCLMTQVAVPLKALQKKYRLEEVHISSYQSVSGSGQRGIDELYEQQLWALQEFPKKKLTPKFYPQVIYNNVLPIIGPLDSEGHSDEEKKISHELRKVLGQETLPVFATAVRVPVFNCHSAAINVRIEGKANLNEIIACMKNFSGIFLPDSQTVESLPTASSMTGRQDVALSRLRWSRLGASSGWLQFWSVADNLKKGSATNLVQVMKMFS